MPSPCGGRHSIQIEVVAAVRQENTFRKTFEIQHLWHFHKSLEASNETIGGGAKLSAFQAASDLKIGTTPLWKTVLNQSGATFSLIAHLLGDPAVSCRRASPVVQTARVFSSSVPTTIRIKRMRNPARLLEVMGV